MTRLFDTIFLHAGLPKTGSSYLQDSLNALSRDGLLARLAYPCASPALGTGNGSALAAELIFTNPEPTTDAQLSALVEEIVQSCDRAATDLLISSEDLCYADVQKFSRLKQVLLTQAKSVKLIVAVRPLREWSYSVYLQLVKSHALAADYDASWLQGHTADFMYYFRNLDLFEVDTICFRYQENDLLRRFLGLLGENEDLASRVPDTVANRSLSPAEASVVRAINGVFGDESLCRQVSSEFVRQQPDIRGARFPAHREADFRFFLANFVRELDRFPGPVLESVRAILLDVPDTWASAEPQQAEPGTLATAEVEIALRTLRAVLETKGDDVALHRKLVGYASRLARTRDRFDPVHYLLLHPDVLRAGIDPRQHFEQHGRKEGRMAAFAPDTGRTPPSQEDSGDPSAVSGAPGTGSTRRPRAQGPR